MTKKYQTTESAIPRLAPSIIPGGITRATIRQIEANRQNAETQKSTDSWTEDGKKRSRLNARKHGLTSRMLIIAGECAEDFDQLLAELMAQLDPQSAFECELVERVGGIFWRLRRVRFFEAAIRCASSSLGRTVGQALIPDGA